MPPRRCAGVSERRTGHAYKKVALLAGRPAVYVPEYAYAERARKG